MTVLNGFVGLGALSGSINPNISTDLHSFAEDEWLPYAVAVSSHYVMSLTVTLPVEAPSRVINGAVSSNYKDDFYERIHISTHTFELGTIITNQTRAISLWNAYTATAAELDTIAVNNLQGVLIGPPLPPLTMLQLSEQSWDITITTNAPFNIDVQVLFDFSNVVDPPLVTFTGALGVVQAVMPEVPVNETWEWLTDEHVAVDGSEQHIGLRRVPRRQLSTKLVFDDQAQLSEQYRVLLTAFGKLFIPYWQYASLLLADADVGDMVLSVVSAPLDIRDDDYVLVVLPNESMVLAQVDTVGTTTLTLKNPLSALLPKGSQVVSIYPSWVPNGLGLNRAATNNYGTLNIRSEAIYPKSTFQRPGSTASVATFDGLPLLEMRPLIDDTIAHAFESDINLGDAKTGLSQLSTHWNFTRVAQDLEFKVKRLGLSDCGGGLATEEFDYWRAFLDEVRGSLGLFLAPTFRPDQTLASPLGVGAAVAIFSGPSYADVFGMLQAYQRLAFFTAAGVHYAKVTAVTKSVGGDTNVAFDPALPVGDGWTDVEQVSYLVQQRIEGDRVDLEHYAVDTFLKFKTRTAAE